MKLLAFVAIVLRICILGHAQPQPEAGSETLFVNVRIFDGNSTTLSPSSNVLIRGNTIERVSISPIDASAIKNVTVINGGGRVLMPGLIDAHWHSFMASVPQMVIATANASYLGLMAARQAEAGELNGLTHFGSTEDFFRHLGADDAQIEAVRRLDQGQ